ncbi:hypothetical protein [Anabaena azotica]|uniref:Transposase n=1 Tax=Anabaena azotica FACHB-119 TaxID=947527 RepID=A0ABR8CZ52_9NOST|nr:hypothetical protein [Anabaena azotica]MBD2500219.1 hypothetical protein [Anabaena azotica FACHB-119]
MKEVNLDENKLKEIFKTAILELIQEQKEVFSEIFTEIIEDIALANAIKEDENTETVSRETIFKIIKNQE